MINPVNNNNIMDYNNIKGKVEEAQQGEFERALQKALDEKDEKKLRKACGDLEAVFLNMMFKQMRNTVEKSGLVDGGSAEEMYEDMLYENYADEIVKGKGVGLADVIFKQLSKNMKKEGGDSNAE